jgi:hypothetical protein
MCITSMIDLIFLTFVSHILLFVIAIESLIFNKCLNLRLLFCSRFVLMYYSHKVRMYMLEYVLFLILGYNSFSLILFYATVYQHFLNKTLSFALILLEIYSYFQLLSYFNCYSLHSFVIVFTLQRLYHTMVYAFLLFP